VGNGGYADWVFIELGSGELDVSAPKIRYLSGKECVSL
jgi:hypothetical protein